MVAIWVAISCIAAIFLSPRGASSQIPTVCANNNNLVNRVCCPNACGENGVCNGTDPMPVTDISDARDNWPHYYTRACECNGNYAGVDCSRCKYGYYGPNCMLRSNLQRKSIQSFSLQQWINYIEILRMAKTHISDYKVVLREYQPGTLVDSGDMIDVTLYNLFVWLHHYAAKDNGGKDMLFYLCGESENDKHLRANLIS